LREMEERAESARRARLSSAERAAEDQREWEAQIEAAREENERYEIDRRMRDAQERHATTITAPRHGEQEGHRPRRLRLIYNPTQTRDESPIVHLPSDEIRTRGESPLLPELRFDWEEQRRRSPSESPDPLGLNWGRRRRGSEVESETEGEVITSEDESTDRSVTPVPHRHQPLKEQREREKKRFLLRRRNLEKLETAEAEKEMRGEVGQGINSDSEFDIWEPYPGPGRGPGKFPYAIAHETAFRFHYDQAKNNSVKTNEDRKRITREHLNLHTRSNDLER